MQLVSNFWVFFFVFCFRGVWAAMGFGSNGCNSKMCLYSWTLGLESDHHDDESQNEMSKPFVKLYMSAGAHGC